jgi:hypothetical protein
MRILEIVFSEFFHDTKQLVAEGVREDIERRMKESGTEEERTKNRESGKRRERNLKLWLAMGNPLAYGHKDNKKTFETLLQAVVAENEDIVHGLPHMTENAITPSALVNSLMSMSRQYLAVGPSAPVVSNGSFLPTLKLGHLKLMELGKKESKEDPAGFVSSMLLYAIQYFDIGFVPYHLPNTRSRGAPNKKAVFNSWAYLGLQDLQAAKGLPGPSNVPSFNEVAASMALSKILSHDSNAEWTIRPLHIKDIGSILHKAKLPSDYATPSPSNANYVNETFEWVKEAYDSRKPLHHLALIVSLMVACLRPKLFLPMDSTTRSKFVGATTKEKVREVYNGLPWVEKKEKKGVSDETLLVSMFTTFIIGVYEPRSPLRVHMETSSRKGLGDAWTAKYSGYLFELI